MSNEEAHGRTEPERSSLDTAPLSGMGAGWLGPLAMFRRDVRGPLRAFALAASRTVDTATGSRALPGRRTRA